MSTPYLKNVAIVGATGQMGSHIVQSLLEGGKHTITAITREDSSSKMPEGVKVAKVNYDSHESLVASLKGQDVLVITMSVRAPTDTQDKLAKACADAGVKWIIPNVWGMDLSDRKLADECLVGSSQYKLCDQIVNMGLNFIYFSCGFWYEYSLSAGEATFGFDFVNKSVTMLDGGDLKLNFSTWEQTGRATAAVLSLDEAGTMKLRNKGVYLDSFYVSQKDMLKSVLKVTGMKESDWTIKHEKAEERWSQARKDFFADHKNQAAFGKTLYSRVFFPDESGVVSKHHELANNMLGLPKEDFDGCTRKAIMKVRAGENWSGQKVDVPLL